MKKILLFVALAFSLSVFVHAGSPGYTVNKAEISALFNNAVEMDLNTMALEMAGMSHFSIGSDDVTTTILIAWVVDWFLGGFGVHRYVLGTSPNMWAIYTFTVCGIFGIVPTVDWFVLLIDGLILDNGEKYINNEKFFMWAN